MITVILAILASWVIANLVEWNVHKYILHEMGNRKGSYWSSHMRRHHKLVRKKNYIDPDYLDSWWMSEHRKSEVYGLCMLAILCLPFAALAFLFTPVAGLAYVLGTLVYVVAYYHLHKYVHLHPKWGFKYNRWHYDHHQIGGQQANWNVVFPLWDYILGTRVHIKPEDKL